MNYDDAQPVLVAHIGEPTPNSNVDCLSKLT